MMDGSRKVSLRNRQFVRKINVPMPADSSGIKPSQFQNSRHGAVPDVQNSQGEDLSVGVHGGQVPEGHDSGDTTVDDAGMRADDQVDRQERVEAEGVGSSVADGMVGQQPEPRSRRNRKPNSKYDPAVYDLDSVKIRGIPLSGKKNGFKGIFWPQ